MTSATILVHIKAIITISLLFQRIFLRLKNRKIALNTKKKTAIEIFVKSLS